MRLSLKVVFKNLPGIKCVKVSPRKPECLVIHNLSAGSPSLLLSTRCKHRNVKTVHSTLLLIFSVFLLGVSCNFVSNFFLPPIFCTYYWVQKRVWTFIPLRLDSASVVSWFAICIVSFIGVSDPGLKIDSALTGNINLKYKLWCCATYGFLALPPPTQQRVIYIFLPVSKSDTFINRLL